MSGEVFVDTNVLVYARDASEPAKQAVAHAWLDLLWRQRAGACSVQVLQEYYATVTRKLKPGLPVTDARRDVRALVAWRPVVVTPDVVERAWAVQDRFGLSSWDALIVGAAQTAGCRTLLTEDLHAGTDFDGLLVVDPFSTAPAVP